MKTDKFTDMIDSLACDFDLAKQGIHSLGELDKELEKSDSKLNRDMELLNELAFLLRHGKAEIVLTEG